MQPGGPLLLFALIALVSLIVVCIAAEVLIGRRRGLRLYTYEDTVLNLASGLGHLVVELAGKSALFGLYALSYSLFHLVQVPAEHPAVWVVGFLWAELAFYAWHRTSHDLAGPWATHAPHHQSRQFNLTVALRASWTSKPLKLAFLLPLATLGLPPLVFLGWQVVGFIYQLFLHTRLIPALGPVEWVFNTPSLHRVHHASNAPYLDKNHGGIVIIWDRVFGTFQRELAEMPVRYGTVTEEPALDLVQLQFGPVWRTLRWAAAAGTWTEGARRWLGAPSAGPPPPTSHRRTRIPQRDRRGLAAALVAIAAGAVAMRLTLPDGGLLHLLPLVALAVWGTRLAVLVHPEAPQSSRRRTPDSATTASHALPEP